MKYIVYMSAATRLMDETELAELLEQSRRRNKKNNITGMLLYSEGTFVQVIEGAEEQVDETYARLVKDIRHIEIIKLDEDKLTERLFPHWSMGFRNVMTGVLAAAGGHLHSVDEGEWSHDEEHPAVCVLKAFAEGNIF